MTHKLIIPLDNSDYSNDLQERLNSYEDGKDEFSEQENLKQPLLSPNTVSLSPVKGTLLKGRLCQKLDKIKAQLSRQGPRNAGRNTTTPSDAKSAPWEYDRFYVSVPDSIPELLIHLDRGRHPEVLELAIESKQRMTPESQRETLEYLLLGAMLITIKKVRRNRGLDAIQSQTLEQLGRQAP